jgi:hypothetical protein
VDNGKPNLLRRYLATAYSHMSFLCVTVPH